MGESINIMEYIDIFKRRKKIMFIIILIFMLVGGLLQYKSEKSYIPTYSSTVSLRINISKKVKSTESDEEESDDDTEYYTSSLSNSTINQSIATGYYSLATSKRAMTELIEKLDLQGTPESISPSIIVKTQENLPEFIDITVTNTDAKLAKKIADAMPEVFSNELKRVIGLDCVEVIYNASEPLVSAKPKYNTLMKFTAVGIAIAIFIVLLLQCLDNKAVTPEDAEKYWGLPIVGIVPYEKENSKGKNANLAVNGE